MATKLERLEFAIGVRDNATSKIATLRGALSKMTDSVRNQFQTAGAGVMGAVGTGYSIHQMVAPAIDLNRALGAVASLGREDTGLAVLQAEAERFAMAYGGSVAEVVRAGNEIQSAIDGLTDKELARFTTASGVLAKATEADVKTMTSYMGAMYGIFQQSADKMGKAQWVDEIAGQTAYAVGLYRSSGEGMSAAFAQLGASATVAGRSAAEQFAVLGTLQTTMSGSESGTKYKAFLAGVGNAQKELGLKFTDSQGNMLGMAEILDKLRGKFGDTLSVTESDQLKKAFGSDEAVSLIKLLMINTDKLKTDIASIADISNLSPAEKMAKRMTDVWARLGGTVSVLSAAFGQQLLPPIENLVGKGVAGMQALVRWIKIAPNLARWVGYGAIAVMLLAGAMGVFTAVVAVNRVAMLALGGPLKMAAFAFGILTKLTGLQTAAQWLLNSAILANPMTWIVLVIVAVIAAVGALIYWWDDLKAAFMDTSWGQALLSTIEAVMTPFKALGDAWDWLQQKMGLAAEKTATAKAIAAGVPQEALERMDRTGLALAASAPPPPAMLEQARISETPSGGVLKAATTQINRSNAKPTTIGSITINSQQPFTPSQLEEWVALQAG